jgi:CRP-like cAMP-binding protein
MSSDRRIPISHQAPCAQCVIAADCPEGSHGVDWQHRRRGEGIRAGLLEKGALLQRERSRDPHFSFVKSGHLALRHTGFDGINRIIGLDGRGMLSGQHVFHGMPAVVTLVALSDVSICEIPFALLESDAQTTAHYREAVMRHNRRAFVLLAGWSQVARMPTLELRLAAALYLLVELQGSPSIEMPSQALMAELLCAKRESVNRAYRALQTKRVWQRPDARRANLDLSALSRLLSGAPSA